MKIVVTIAQKIGIGILYGIGFGIATGVIYYFISEKMMTSSWSDTAMQRVIVTKHEKVQRGGSVCVLGTIENQGTKPVRFINVQVDLFDKNRKFVEQCSEYIKGTIPAGESVNFKVTCSGYKDKPVVEHETYKVRIAGI